MKLTISLKKTVVLSNISGLGTMPRFSCLIIARGISDVNSWKYKSSAFVKRPFLKRLIFFMTSKNNCWKSSFCIKWHFRKFSFFKKLSSEKRSNYLFRLLFLRFENLHLLVVDPALLGQHSLIITLCDLCTAWLTRFKLEANDQFQLKHNDSVTRFFIPFGQNTLSGSHMNRLKLFCETFRFCEDIR